jgi:Icc-related predicted phosphoesterase
MLRLAYISDLHLDHWGPHGFNRPNRLAIKGPVTFPDAIDADVLIIAGDVHPDIAVRDRLVKQCEDHYGIPVLLQEGNHDYYGSDFPLVQEPRILTVEGVKILGVTLWTYLDPMAETRAISFPDFKEGGIKNHSCAKQNYAHAEAIRAITAEAPDIVVSHHAPSILSIAPRFKGQPENAFFYSSLENLILDMQPKLWVHGHVHDSFDYELGDTRVVCNPLGYPFEKRFWVDVQIAEVASKPRPATPDGAM